MWTDHEACFAISDALDVMGDGAGDTGSSIFIDLTYTLMTGKTYPIGLYAHNTYKENNPQ